MTERWSETLGVLPRLAVLALAIAAIGLPINNLYAYALFAGSAFVLLHAHISADPRRWFAASALALIVVAQHALLPAPRIEEGHNVFLIDAPGNALEKGLPAEAYRAMAARFDAAYPPDQRCTRGEVYCWRPGAVPKQAFAFAADGALDRPMYSRRIAGVDFDNPIWLRLGIVNDLSLDILEKGDSIARLFRDRRSLAILGRWQLKLPYFVMYRFPSDFAGSRLCWRGALLWETADETFEPLDSKERTCRELRPEDIGRRIFGFAIGPDAKLAMTLEANWSVTLRRALDASTAAVGVLGILMLLVRWQFRGAKLSAVLIGSALLLVIVIDVTFIGGYRPYDGGEDGLIFSGFARVALQALLASDLLQMLRGAEDVYGFTPGTRYFRMLEYLFFGDSYLGYLTLVLGAPLIVLAVCRRFLGQSWGLAFTLGFVVTPAGALFGTSYLHHVEWAARGYGDPLGALLFLAGLLLLAGPTENSWDRRAAPAFWGALLLALAVVVRPNLLPGALVLLGGVTGAALWQREFRRAAAIGVGVLPIMFPAWHNWFFGGAWVPFSQNLTAESIYRMSPEAYWGALGELVRFNLKGELLARAVRQVLDLLSGPLQLRLLTPLHVLGTLVVIRVAWSRRFEPMLRLTALAALALTTVGLIFVAAVRYHLVMWLLMALVVVAWIKIEGMTWLDRHRPGWRESWMRSRHLARAGRAITWLNARS